MIYWIGKLDFHGRISICNFYPYVCIRRFSFSVIFTFAVFYLFLSRKHSENWERIIIFSVRVEDRKSRWLNLLSKDTFELYDSKLRIKIFVDKILPILQKMSTFRNHVLLVLHLFRSILLSPLWRFFFEEIFFLSAIFGRWCKIFYLILEEKVLLFLKLKKNQLCLNILSSPQFNPRVIFTMIHSFFSLHPWTTKIFGWHPIIWTILTLQNFFTELIFLKFYNFLFDQVPLTFTICHPPLNTKPFSNT